jgi:hypothetical protein
MHHQDEERRDAPHPHEADEVLVYQWSEAHSLAVHFLELALLA